MSAAWFCATYCQKKMTGEFPTAQTGVPGENMKRITRQARHSLPSVYRWMSVRRTEIWKISVRLTTRAIEEHDGIVTCRRLFHFGLAGGSLRRSILIHNHYPRAPNTCSMAEDRTTPRLLSLSVNASHPRPNVIVVELRGFLMSPSEMSSVIRL